MQKVTWPFDNVVLRDNVSKQNHCISTTAVSKATNEIEPLATRPCGITWQTRVITFPLAHFHFHCLWPPNLVGWWLTPHERLLLIKLRDPLVTRSWKITWQTKAIISWLTKCLLTTNLVGWWLTARNSHPISHMTFWLHDQREVTWYLTNLYLSQRLWPLNLTESWL